MVDLLSILIYPINKMEDFGKYTLIHKLGTGGMAEVFLAKEPLPHGLERLVVVKRLLPYISEDEKFITLFLDEARLVAQLNHPNIATVYDFGEVNGEYYIAMEYVDGPTLSKFIKSCRSYGGVPLAHALYIIEQVLNGLNYAHTKKDIYGRPLNIIHRDISPQNIIISRDGGVKLVDFGVAKSSIQEHLTVAGTVKGKYSYLAPEVCLKKGWDQRVDLWAVGVVLYETLSGEPLFRRANELSTIKAVIEYPIPPIRKLRPELPSSIEEFLKKALERDPTKRFLTAQQMLLSLEEIIDKLNIRSSAIRLKLYLEKLIEESPELISYREPYELILKGGASLNSRDNLSQLSLYESSSNNKLQDKSLEEDMKSTLRIQSDPSIEDEEIYRKTLKYTPQSNQNISDLQFIGTDSRSEITKEKNIYLLVIFAILFILFVGGITILVLNYIFSQGTEKTKDILTTNLHSSNNSTKNKIETKKLIDDIKNGRLTKEEKNTNEVTKKKETDNISKQLSKEKKTAEKISSEKSYGYITIDTRPWSKVYIGSSLIGATPIYKYKLATGKYSLKFVTQDNQEYYKIVEVKKDKETRSFFKFSN